MTITNPVSEFEAAVSAVVSGIASGVHEDARAIRRELSLYAYRTRTPRLGATPDVDALRCGAVALRVQAADAAEVLVGWLVEDIADTVADSMRRRAVMVIRGALIACIDEQSAALRLDSGRHIR